MKIPLRDLPMFWQGRARALRLLDADRESDPITLQTALTYETCAAELKAALADQAKK